MTTRQPRKMITFPEDVKSDLEWLLDDERKKRKNEKKKGQFHECHMLASGICTQATVSNIEKKNTCDSVDILNKICQRLEIDMTVLFYEEGEENIRKAVEQVKNLCQEGKSKKAYQVIVPLKETEVANPLLQTAFYYSIGLVYFLEKEDESETLFYLHQATDTTAKNTIYRPLAYSLLGQLYERRGEEDKAEAQYTRALQLLETLKIDYPKEAISIYYQAGKYMRAIGDIERAKVVLEKGLAVNQKLDTMYLLENQWYELALCESNESPKFEDCLTIARFKNNKQLIRKIISE